MTMRHMKIEAQVIIHLKASVSSFSCYTKDTFHIKKLFIIIDEQFILRVYIKINIMYKSFRVHCDVHTWRPCVGRSRLQVRMLSDLDTLSTLYFWPDW